MSVSVEPGRQRCETGLGLVIDPPPGRWPGQIRFEPTARQKALRTELGLPTDRPVVMSGHQASFWGPGILAKWIATVEGAAALGAHPAWLVADQDAGDASVIRYPSTEDGEPRPGLARLDPARPDSEHNKPTSSQRPIRVGGAVPDEVGPIAEALRAHEGEPDAARQVQAALADLIAPIEPAPGFVFARELSRTTLFAELVGRMRDDPAACARAYNDAVAMYPDAGVRPLVTTDEERGVELPLWVVADDGGRRRATSGDLRDTPPDRLAPRALLLTAFVRLGACELFVHGTGGGAYDKVSEAWIETWLGDRLAPAAVVTATVLPDVGGIDLAPVERAEHAAWRAHAARHNPSVLDDREAEEDKRRLLAKIESASTHDPDRAIHYRELHSVLDAYREKHGEALSALEREAEALQALAAGSRRGAAIARDRTLAFPLVPRARLEALRDAIRDRMRAIG